MQATRPFGSRSGQALSLQNATVQSEARADWAAKVLVVALAVVEEAEELGLNCLAW